MRNRSFVFRGPDRTDRSCGAVRSARRLERGDLTAQGSRSTFRDWAAERTNYPREVAEKALAHAAGRKVEAAYRRTDLFQAPPPHGQLGIVLRDATGRSRGQRHSNARITNSGMTAGIFGRSAGASNTVTGLTTNPSGRFNGFASVSTTVAPDGVGMPRCRLGRLRTCHRIWFAPLWANSRHYSISSKTRISPPRSPSTRHSSKPSGFKRLRCTYLCHES